MTASNLRILSFGHLFRFWTTFITYYLLLPAASGLGRDFWFIGIFWEKGFLAWFCFFLSLGIGTSLC